MKKEFNKIIVLFTLTTCFSLPNSFLAQTIPTVNPVNCAFYIWNHRNCYVTVHYEVSDCNANIPNPGACGNGIVCFNYSLVIAPNTKVYTSCCVQNPGAFSSPPCYSPGGDIFVWLKEIDYVDVTGGNNSQAVSGGNCMSSGGLTGGGTVPSSVSSPCNSPSTWSISWSSNGVDIN